MIFANELTSLESELSQLEMMLTAKRQELGFFQNLQTQADECLEKLSRVVNHAKENTASGAIASLKSAVLTLFADDSGGNDDSGNSPTDPTPDTDPTPGADDQVLNAGSRFWFGAESNTGTVIQQQGHVEYEVQIDGAIGTVMLDREQLHYIPSTLEGQACDIDKAPLTGQACEWACPVYFADMPQPKEPSTEMVHLSANCGYLKLKEDGRILAAYCWFSRKNIAEAWVQQLEVIPSAFVEMRESKRNSSWKWELKVAGLNLTQIERLSKEALHLKPKKESPAQAAGIEPPSDWRKPQVKEELPPCPFGIGDIIDWNGSKLRVGAIGVESLHCVLPSEPDGTKPHTRVPFSECVLVEEGLDVGDRVEIRSDRYLGIKGKELIVNGVYSTSELPIGVQLPNGNTRYFPRNELKFLAKAPSTQPATGLTTGVSPEEAMAEVVEKTDDYDF